MNKALGAEGGAEKCTWGPSVSKGRKRECHPGLSYEWAGVRHHTPQTAATRGTAREKWSSHLHPTAASFCPSNPLSGYSALFLQGRAFSAL